MQMYLVLYLEGKWYPGWIFQHQKQFIDFLKKSKADAALTRAIDAIEFKETVHVGDWVNFEANIISTGKSSIVIKIDAYKESKEIEKTLACTARFTFVSVQKDQFGTYKKFNHNQTI